jgi:phenylacetate-CoA ligase
MKALDLYHHLPAFLQGITLSVYSCCIFRKKYNKSTQYKFLLDGKCLEKKSVVSSSFSDLIRFSIENVPFYKDLASQKGIDIDAISISNYKDFFPVITKDQIRQNPKDFIATNKIENPIIFFTSGTSGSPLEIVSFPSDRKKNYDYFRAVLNEFGADVFSESATFAGRVLFKNARNNIFWRRDSFLNTTYFSTYHMSEESLKFYVAHLDRLMPVYIDSYPSAIFELAKFICDEGISLSFSPKFVLTSSETLSDEAREVISKAFNGCPVVDYYGCTEMCVMAYAVDGGSYVFPEQYSLVEFIPIGGGFSKIVATGLVNRAMPFIRYETGDVCLNPSAKDSPVQSCEKIIGREDDLIKTPDGKKIGRMDPVFKGVRGIERAQIVQESLTKIEVNVVLQEGVHDFDDSTLVRNIIVRIGADIDVQVNLVDEIALTKSGKFKAVISKV